MCSYISDLPGPSIDQVFFAKIEIRPDLNFNNRSDFGRILAKVRSDPDPVN